MGALDELLAAWRANPDAGATVALCSYLGSSGREDLIREVGASAQQWHVMDTDVMVATGRMYLDCGLYAEAQAALVAAGKAEGKNASAYRFLGEVLLRRGDAMRAEKVLARALQLGSDDAETRLWHDRCTVYSSLQNRVGVQAVAAEVARALPNVPSLPPPLIARSDSFTGAEPDTLPTARAAQPDFITGPAYPLARPASARPPPLPNAFVPPAPVWGGAAPPIVPDPWPQRVAPVLRGSRSDLAEADAEIVLAHLARVGVYEPGGGAPPAWERAERKRSRGAWVLAVATVLVLGAGGGGFAYAKRVKQQRMAQAATLCGEVDHLLETGRVEDLRSTDQRLASVFELDSRSLLGARLWLENRVLGALLLPEPSRGVDSAAQRLLTLGVADHEVSYAKVASFLVEDDVAGAAALLPKWDAKSAQVAYYQLVAGATLERAGDSRALERYEAAVKLDDKLVAAELLLAQLALLELGPEKAKPILESVRKKLGDAVSARALVGLAWVVDPARSDEAPKEAALSAEDRKSLPVPLAAAPHIFDATVAMTKGDHAKFEEAVSFGIAAAGSPAMATSLGFLAIQAGDAELARKAALRALQFSALYPRARVLASRVALLGGRLEEAKKAIEELDPKSADVAVVRAALAYETLDVSGLAGAVEAFGDPAPPPFAALVAARGVLAGTASLDAKALTTLASPEVAWGELVALDAALDGGHLVLGEEIVARWDRAAVARPVYALRVARLRRYQGKASEAAELSAHALEAGAPTSPLLIERVYDLIAADRPKEAADVVARYPALLGPMTAWLGMLCDAAAGHVADANVKAAQQELPPDAAPLILRVLATRALAAAGDRREKAWIKPMLKRYPKHPDVLLAAAAK